MEKNLDNGEITGSIFMDLSKAFDAKKTKNFMAPFSYGRVSTDSRLELLLGGSLLFTTKFSEIPATHFTDLGRMKG